MIRSLASAVGIFAIVLLAALAVRSPAQEAAQSPYDVPEKHTLDPVKANGEIFVDWPKPPLAIMFSGELDGYLEPCGCAGLENQLGGLMRRHTLIKMLESEGWPLVRLDLGGLTKRVGVQAGIKFRYALESLVDLGYSAVAIGANELKLNIDAVAGAVMNLDPAKNPVTSANVGVYGLQESLDLGLRKAFRIVEAGGKRIGVTAVLGARHQAAVKNLSAEDVGYADPVEALADVAAALKAENCDLQVLLVHGDPDEAAELSQKFPQFQIVATAGGAAEPPARAKTIEGSGATLIEVGHKGMYVIVLGFYPGQTPSVRYQRVPLDARFADSPQMKARLTAYQQELKTMTLEGLGLTGTPHPDGEFVGSETCGDCHTKAWEVFEQTPHAHATDTLVKLDPPRQFDPECLSCHVTGWNPQQYLPYKSGFIGLEETPAMMQNGCENCHGPGGDHVKAESGEVEVTPQQRDALRAAMRMKIIENEGNNGEKQQVLGKVVDRCLQCHDDDNSPDFDFQEYWPHVEHEGVD
jgi:hypothetical protein